MPEGPGLRHGQNIRALLENESSGVLATLSSLAEHTRNVRADSRASLLVQDHASLADSQAGARITVLGHVERVPESGLDSSHKRYLGKHPRAAEYLSLGDFQLYVLRVREARFIGGFGDMGWIEGERLLAHLEPG